MKGGRIEFSIFRESERCEACIDCEKREEGCHSKCEEYLKVKLVMDLLRGDVLKEQARRTDEKTYMIERGERRAMGKHWSNRYGKARKRR